MDPADVGTHGTSLQGSVEDMVLVSNREPYRHHHDGEDIAVDAPAGGLASGIDPVMQRMEGTWIAWGDGEADFEVADDDGQVTVPPSNPSYTLQRLRLSEEQVRGYYDGYANQTLWPLCHSDTGRLTFEPEHWERYREVNQRFADEVLAHADEDTTVWFQDYHFMLAPQAVRARVPEAFLMHFLHLPWPAPDVFRVCPHAEELLEGLLGTDLLGFHHPRYAAQFLKCVDQLVDGAVVDWAENRVHHRGRATRVGAFPLGVDADEISWTTAGAEDAFWTGFRDAHGIDADTTTAVGVDRLDYTKGIPQRLSALERLFEERPDLRGEFTYIQKGCSTRERIPAYQQLREEVEDRIAGLDERFGTDDWSPVVYTTEMYDREELFSLYHHSDLALVTPLRDGMNLVAKEYVASQLDDDGVLLLSPMAGAYDQLEEGVVEFDPYDASAGAEAIEQALAMDDDERQERMRTLRHRVHDEDLSAWMDDVLGTASEVHASRTEASR
ncbi:trehalose-6-phosphate synthase [Halobacteriales archaeon QS_4_70_19]|nr:MAG: trehalose-6-phosphate synthase [Halobacteriales archaeon QS_4_70_19]